MEVLHGGVVGGMVSRALGSMLQSAEFLMRDSEIFFEMQPGLVGLVVLTPHFKSSENMPVLKTKL